MGERGWDGGYTFHYFVVTEVSTFKVTFILNSAENMEACCHCRICCLCSSQVV